MTTKQDYKKIEKAILGGKAYVKIDRVSASGMTRYMRVYIHTKQGLRDATNAINDRLQRGMDKNRNLKVGGCGMDMCMHTLYCALGYEKAKNRNQRYNII